MRSVFMFYIFHESSQKFVEVAKTKNPIRYARFAPLRDPPLAASRMRSVFVFYVFHESSQKFVEVAKTKNCIGYGQICPSPGPPFGGSEDAFCIRVLRFP